MPDPADALDDFVALSAILTGIEGDKLHPVLDAYGTAEELFVYATKNGGALFAQLMQTYTANKDEPPEVIAGIIFKDEQAPIAYMARTVILMWYLGAWFTPKALADYHANPTGFAPYVVISSNTYTQSWVWRVGQTHPMGYSDWRFGYWHTPPLPLTDFIGGSGS